MQKNERIWQKHLFLSFFFCNFVGGNICEQMEKDVLIDLINKSMRETEQRLRSLGRMPYAITREDALRQVAMLQRAKVAWQTGKH